MSASQDAPSGPDFSLGVAAEDVPRDGLLSGHCDGEAVILARRDDGWLAVSGACTHYGAPLGEGLMLGDTVHCPWHHACFSLRTGEALGAPAIDRLDCWRVEVEGGRVFVRDRAEPQPRPEPSKAAHPRRVVIVGGGAAGFAAAEMLRRRGYQGDLTMLSADDAPPCDRPNLSKDYLAGTAPEDWIPLKPPAFYAEQSIDLRLGFTAARLDLEAREVVGENGERLGYDALLLATGAEPIRLKGPGFDHPNVHVLRSLADARAVIAAAEQAARVVVVGASFIGLEAAAALRARGLQVHVVAPETTPLERVMGPQIGAHVRRLHEKQGVQFHLGLGVDAFDGEAAVLSDGTRLEADFVVLGVGVRPRLTLAVEAGLEIENGVVVDAGMRTSRPGVYAAGDIAAWPGRPGGERQRVEHWVVAERQGQIAALSILGEDAALTEAPFFWSQHYDTAIRYVGHARTWDHLAVDGSIAEGDATVRFESGGRLLAAATLGRDLENLKLGQTLDQES